MLLQLIVTHAWLLYLAALVVVPPAVGLIVWYATLEPEHIPAPKPAPRPHGRHELGDLERSQASVPVAELLAALRAERPAVRSHRAGVAG